MCGILAILLADPSAAVNQDIYDGLTALQHRGQDAAGKEWHGRGVAVLRVGIGVG